MSNSHPLRPFTAVGEIDHVHILSEHIGALLIGEEYGDVTFVVEKKRFPAHRVILAARCQYFRALLYGGMRESQPEAEIPLQDTTAEAFTMLLKYIYTGRATLTDEKEEVLLDFLSLAHKYGFPELEDSTSEYLCTILNIQNVCMTFDVASLYSLPKLTCMCCMFMDRNAQEVLSSEGFLSLSKTALLNIVLRDSFAAPEKDIFLALLNWCKHNSNENHAEIMQAVRLPLMSLTELLNVVRPSGLLSPDAILDAIKVRSESRDMDLNYRGMLIPEENIATMKYGAQVVKGELKSALLDGDTQNYDLDHGFSRHPIDDDCRSGIEIKLGQPSIINHIRILLWDRDSRSYSYFIEVSMDELDWIRVIDHSQYLCRSWQKLYFPARVCSFTPCPGRYDHRYLLRYSSQHCQHRDFGFSPPEKFSKFFKQKALLYNLKIKAPHPCSPPFSSPEKMMVSLPFTSDTSYLLYIRIVGTHNTVNKIFHIVAFECMFTNKTFTLEKGLIVPMENVATIADCASVIEGVSRSRNALLNGDTKNYDWDSGYTCHQLGSGAIVVQLAQPYMIGSIRLLLWDCDDRSYSYYVEVSTNQQQWTMVADRTKVSCKSWQSVTFERRPASFIRIVGTHNTANEVFHCVHFECPEQQSAQKDSSDEPGTGGASAAGQQLDPHALQAPSGSSLPSSPGSNSRSPNRQHQ
ncbi:BTB/POZ domain-containing protein 9 isoform X2 [Bubalus kerabau]|uniref:BTB/POZ domain-containing protein 9 isoform X1 n=1 Tax=Bubalus bubalis TaxID=89462 RepID=UPI001E1B9271|nr:BTB/POZ domain-containing protein 9 isoform X1 [Bubalus bubalis]XP_025116807.2 BTB/POZ domain-containing protein 9 isoform X1 [Bubalus bubalis]XP_025116816.2 BTB/POZ domain-containing protein 9 isoform X1 [Bubalus bubalis]XP_044794274.2 BTB/POZ domain-containing protein 9 isoform X1 [Bubalus bubalis]XP_055427472.1 BTB/POZ domain-containing protein 9 isoform X2 [Bubalus carabanensis]